VVHHTGDCHLYAIPRIINRPLYSHLLSLISFFTIAFFYTGVGAHHLLQAPIPEYVKTIGVTMSVLMMIPVLTFVTNIGLTLRGSWHTLVEHIPFRFIIAGWFMYLLTSLQGTFQGLRGTNSFLHFSQWTVGHAHLAILGSFGFLAVGIMYWLIPKLTGVRIYSHRLMSISFWLATVAFILFFLAMTTAGLVANSVWWQNMNVESTLPFLQFWYIVRAIGGGLIVVAAYIFALNALLSFIIAREPHEVKNHFKLPKIETSRPHSKYQRASQQKLNMPIIVAGAFSAFTIMTYMVVGMPYMFASVEPSSIAHPYTAQEEKGRILYKDLGCFYCHSQFVRPQDWVIGRTSQKGDYFYDSPHLLGRS
jgi:cytochrome c oxidase cbb3-type subunit I/II